MAHATAGTNIVLTADEDPWLPLPSPVEASEVPRVDLAFSASLSMRDMSSSCYSLTRVGHGFDELEDIVDRTVMSSLDFHMLQYMVGIGFTVEEMYMVLIGKTRVRRVGLPFSPFA